MHHLSIFSLVCVVFERQLINSALNQFYNRTIFFISDILKLNDDNTAQSNMFSIYYDNTKQKLKEFNKFYLYLMSVNLFKSMSPTSG